MNKPLIGIFIVVGIAASWCSCKQLTFVMQTVKSFRATFFIMWYQTSFISFSLLYPFITCQPIKETLRKDHMPFKKLIKMGAIFYLIWLISNYFAILALKNISSSLMVAVFSVSPAFVYLLSWLVLKDPLTTLKSMAVISAVAGVVCIGVSQEIVNGNMIGILFAMLSALFAAFYVVFLKKLIGTTTVATATVLLGVIGLINTVMFWPGFLILDYTGLEVIVWNDIPWDYLNLSAVTGFFFNAFVNIGIAYTYPLFISIGTILGIPANIFVDWLIHNLEITFLQLLGSGFVIVAFCLLVFSNFFGKQGKEEAKANERLIPKEREKLLDSDSERKVKSFSLEKL